MVNQLMVIPLPQEADDPYSFGWSGTNTHHFAVQSAYNLQ
jgi:hypothetical protein